MIALWLLACSSAPEAVGAVGFCAPSGTGPSAAAYPDGDGDGFGTEPVLPWGCGPSAHASVGGDCDDADPAVNPAAVEICDDGVDNDCDRTANDCGPPPLVSLEGVGATRADMEDSVWFGLDVASVGDVTGDRFPDLLDGGSVPGRRGIVVIEGGNRPAVGAGPPVRFVDSEYNPGAFAWGTGDLDGDSWSDVVLGTGSLQVQPIAVVLAGGPDRLGAPLTRLFTATAGLPQMPTRLAIADFDGDGRADLGVAASEFVLLFGPLPSGDVSLDEAAARVDQLPTGAPGDVDGDGLPEIPSWNGYTSFCAVTPDASNLTIAASGYCAQAPKGVFSAFSGGDNDGDGYDDVLVGTSRPDPDYETTLQVFRGGPPDRLDGGWEPAATIYREPAQYMHLAEGARWVGPVTGASSDAFVLPAVVGTEVLETYDTVGLLFAAPVEGAVDAKSASWLMTQSPTDSLAVHFVLQRIAVAGADLDQDGYSDVALGAHSALDGPQGAVYILYGHGL